MLADIVSIISDRALTKEEISTAASELLDASVADDLKADLLRAWAARGETGAELALAAEAFLPQALKPGVQGFLEGRALLDCCGTGGGGLDLVNISTGAMFVLSAMGIPVVKHGNRGITKKSGSADVLEALGVKIDLAPEKVETCLEEAGCAFLFAPAYHATFAAVGPVRRRLAAEGQRTIFNLLGPLLNPARPDARLVGVFKPEHLPLYREALEHMRCPKFAVVCGQDATSGTMLGEVSADGVTVLSGTVLDGDNVLLDRLEIRSQHVPPNSLKDLLVRNADESASRLLSILSGEEQELERETLLLNAAVAGWMHGSAASLEEGLAQAEEAIDSGRALSRLKNLQELSERV